MDVLKTSTTQLNYNIESTHPAHPLQTDGDETVLIDRKYLVCDSYGKVLSGEEDDISEAINTAEQIMNEVRFRYMSTHQTFLRESSSYEVPEGNDSEYVYNITLSGYDRNVIPAYESVLYYVYVRRVPKKITLKN